MQGSAPETAIDPDLPIVDPHHHFWDSPPGRGMRSSPYLLPQFLEDANSGHNVIASVFVECGSMYRAAGPEALKPVGEVEFVNGQAAMAASGRYGHCLAAAGIVGHADLRLGAGVEETLDGLLTAAPQRLRGVRMHIHHTGGDLGCFGQARTREGFAKLAPRGLSFDVWCLHSHLGPLIELARAFPETSIILDHLGTPNMKGGAPHEVRAHWLTSMETLSKLPNVSVKLSGLGMPFAGVNAAPAGEVLSSEVLARMWRPYIEPCIELFGVARAMFASNFPVDRVCCSYAVLWNAFKRISAGASEAEKAALFAGSARKIYRLAV